MSNYCTVCHDVRIILLYDDNGVPDFKPCNSCKPRKKEQKKTRHEVYKNGSGIDAMGFDTKEEREQETRDVLERLEK